MKIDVGGRQGRDDPGSAEASRAALKRAMPLIIVALLLALVAVFCE